MCTSTRICEAILEHFRWLVVVEWFHRLARPTGYLVHVTMLGNGPDFLNLYGTPHLTVRIVDQQEKVLLQSLPVCGSWRRWQKIVSDEPTDNVAIGRQIAV